MVSVAQACPQAPGNYQSKCLLIYPPAYPAGTSDSNHPKEDLRSTHSLHILVKASFTLSSQSSPSILSSPTSILSSYLQVLVLLLPSLSPYRAPPSPPPPLPPLFNKSIISCTWATCRATYVVFLLLSDTEHSLNLSTLLFSNAASSSLCTCSRVIFTKERSTF